MDNQIKFIENYVFPKIIAENNVLNDLKFIRADISRGSSIDGFMGNIIFASLVFETKDRKNVEKKVVVKLMKPPSHVRMTMNADYQFINEVFIYETVIPTFLEKFQSKFKTIEKSLWCPQTYLAESGQYPALSDTTESILVMEDLTEKGFTLGPRINLTVEELTLMTEAIAQFHACTYALRINNDPDLERLINGLVPFKFPNKANPHTLYVPLYTNALERIWSYFDNNPKEIDNEIFGRNLNILRTKYSNDPMSLMNRFLRSDNDFSVILHGDYNRNNVLFKYEQKTAVDLRFIDFQEVKYGSPAIDLSFFMYINIHPSLFENGLNETLLNRYHDKLIASLCELLDCKPGDARLTAYCWDDFYKHFKQFAFYGAMVAVMFVPWMACPENECAQLAEEVERDACSEEMRQLQLHCGGNTVDQRIVAVLRNASKLGYMDMIIRDD
ncbi:uncharacterized protein LOC119082299 [Bradysia coprophila]|uniref:uncharacterized protein LOC119082299 n=1 Tax=Bradysia coprophila TaxID=38358 RepID=UPI00187DD4C6|nr:uncharacterized protein LOC119082299 [Bradysia coprophila]